MINEEPETTVIIRGGARKFIKKFLPGTNLGKRMSIKKAKELYNQAIVASRLKYVKINEIKPGAQVVRRLQVSEVYEVVHIDEEGFVHLKGVEERIQPQELENVAQVW